jgi:diguanylate cyclase (GGDEF)-like protein/PAS domain S-box-containing protein
MPVQAEANLSALIESSEDPIWSVDLEHRLLTFNQALQRNSERNLGVRAEIGMSPKDFPAKADGVAWTRLYNRALSEGPFRTEFSISTGQILELSFNPIVVNGKPEGVSVFGKDVTEQRRSQRELLEAEKKYRDLFDGAVEGMFQRSLIGEMRSMNMAMATMLGCKTQEAMNAHLQSGSEEWWANPQDRQEFRDRLLRDGAVHGFEAQWKRLDGSQLWVSISSKVVYDDRGTPLAHHGFVKDITERKRTEMHLRDSEERFRATFEQAAVGIIHVSFEGEILDCNPRFASILGYSQEELVGMTVQQITPQSHLAMTDAILQELALDGPEHPSWEKPYLRKDGLQSWVRLTASMQRDGQGRALHLIAFAEDINAQRSAEEALTAASRALKTSEARYRTVFQTILDAVTVTRASTGVFIEVNEAFLRTTGLERSEVIGKTAREINIWVDPQDQQRVNEALQRNASFRDLEFCFRRKNGEKFWSMVSASTVELAGQPCIISVSRDISDVKAAQDKIRDLAFFDPLTRLPNRRLMVDRLQQALTTSTRNPRKLALLFIDLDNFKVLNDAQGHQTGDMLLQEVAMRLTRSVRESDSVARLGGDEFAILLDGLSGTKEDAAAQAKLVAEKIFSALGKTYLLNGRELHSHSSIGITVFGAPHRNLDEILQQAEIAMYQAKAAGRNSIRFFSPALQAVVNARAKLEQDLRLAIKNKQFSLYYQPQVDGRGLVGAEALIRWNHPTRGLLLPGEFIPLAEETGLILDLGIWTLEAACAQMAEWSSRDDIAPFSLAINISARQFRQSDFVDQVLFALGRSGAHPASLKLELTESMLVENIEDVIAKMTVLRTRGLSFSLDDFGTGYSSLSYLKRLPLDQLKIDRAFVRDILSDVSSGAIAQTIISLSRAMGLSVIAEGVETKGQRDFLIGLGCSSFQGYLFSRPLPVNEFEKQWMVQAPFSAA